MGRDINAPPQWFVGYAQGFEDLVVEILLPEQQLVDDPQEFSGLGALDNAVIIGGCERGDLGDSEVVDMEQGSSLELRRVVDAPDPQNHSLPIHQARYGMVGSDTAGIGDGDGCPGEISHGEVAGACFGDNLFVVCPELCEVEFLASLDVGNQELAGAV